MTDNDQPDILKLPLFIGTPATADQTSPMTPASSSPAHHLLAATGHVGTAAARTSPVEQSALTRKHAAQDLDWTTVSAIRKQVADALAQKEEETDTPLTVNDRKELARSIAHDVIRDHATGLLETGGDSQTWDPAQQQAIAKAVMDSLFGLGRLQPLVDVETITDIHISRFNNVFVKHMDGRLEKVAPIAASDEEFINELQFIAGHQGEASRNFSATFPILEMDLPSQSGRLAGARLSAEHPPAVPWPNATIRIHRLIDITLDELVRERHTMTPQVAQFLAAAVKAYRTVAVSGEQGAGKTTLVRALANEIGPDEPIVTIEKERELYLHLMEDRHPICYPFQFKPGQGERDAMGRMPGEINLVELLEHSLRKDTRRVIVGEVRGGEINTMFQAMQAGAGTFSTLHADDCEGAIERLTTLATANAGVTAEHAYRQIEAHIHLIVQISTLTDPNTGQNVHKITEICEVTPGDNSRPAVTPLFKLDPVSFTQRPVFRPREQLLTKLVDAGMDPAIFRSTEAAA